MSSEDSIVISTSNEAKEVIQRRANAYESTVQKASSLLQLIIGGLSVIAALAAAGLVSEFTSVLFEPDGIETLSTGEIVASGVSAVFYFFLLV